ncbi:MAG TPA: ethanolamine ammonia-lyase light chain EutC, partial [Stellaceae bacterium]|nr:ethanolamine ammonia-lyase light chain EutC [Stellaceae bacterium]
MTLPADPRWTALRRATPARIGLRRAGVALATSEQLAFQAAHALARDAVHDRLDAPALVTALAARGLTALALRSAAADRRTYLARPD